jgi:hypothetical protein
MKLLLCLLLPMFSGCQTRIFDNGKPAVMIGSNLDGEMSYQTPTCHFTYKGKMNNSTPTRAVGSIVATVGSDVVASLVPGSGVVPVVGRAAVSGIPHVRTTAP